MRVRKAWALPQAHVWAESEVRQKSAPVITYNASAPPKTAPATSG